MSIHRLKSGKWQVRYRVGVGATARHPSKTFDRKRDAERFEAEVRRRKQLGDLYAPPGGAIRTLDDYVTGTWGVAHAQVLAPKTRKTYGWAYDRWIGPRLGATPLCDLTPDVIARFQADLIAAGCPPEARRKSMALLGGILQRAAEARLIPYNPARLVRKARVPKRQEVRPLAPRAVEALRAVLGHRDATVVAVLAYAGLRAQELRALRWEHVGDKTLLVNAEKTDSRRTVRLLAPLRRDLAEWRLACGRPHDAAPVIPGDDGGEWSSNGFNKWRARVFLPALQRAGLPRARPYDLRHSFASLLLHERRSLTYVARELGHSVAVLDDHYAHVIRELEDEPSVSAEAAILAARGEVVRSTFA